MPTLTVKANISCAVSLNGGFLTFLEEASSYTMPMPQGYFFLSAVAVDSRYEALNYFIKDSRLLTSGGRLCRWSEDILELFFCFSLPRAPLPPVLTKELNWNGGYAGIIGEYFILEREERKVFPEPAEDFFVISESRMLLKSGNTYHVVDGSLNTLLTFSNVTEASVKNGLDISFYMGDMDLILFKRSYSPDMKLISSQTSLSQPQGDLDRLRLFCQAVRLELKNEAFNFLTDDLKAEMDFQEIKEFLGIFDQVDLPRYCFNERSNTLALRYMVDQSNFHYICYEFTFDTTTGVALIDDIAQL